MSENGDNAVYVYGVVRATASSAVEGTGIDDRPLGVVTLDELGALTSEIPSGPLEAGKDELLAHARALERALAWSPVLPMRFGSVMDGEEEVKDRLLEPHHAALASQLDEMEGKVEVAIKGIYDESIVLSEVVAANREVAALREATAATSEAATYPERIRLGELIAEELAIRREADSAAIVERLSKEAVATSVGEQVHERMAVSASFLVERDRLAAFDRALDEIAEEQGGRTRFTYTGPLPPHSFVELSLGG
jgi:hypothetical protein